MTTKIRSLTFITAFASTLAFEAAHAADASNLVAPIYTGAVPAVLADGVKVDPFYVGTFGNVKALDCGARATSRDIAGKEITAKEAEAAGESAGPWCFLSRDPIDKVKAFYDKAIGPMRPIQGEHGEHGFIVFAERAWFPGGGEEESPGLRYSSVSVHALAPPRVLGNAKSPDLPAGGFEGQEAYKFYAQSRFAMFVDGVDWFGDPSKRKQSELDAIYKQYGHLESALFQRKGPTLQTADALIGKRYSDLREQRQKAAVMAPITGVQRLNAGAASNDAGPTAAEDAKLNSIMQKNPQLAQRYMALTQQVAALMTQGKYDEADPLLDQIDELEQSNPELAALNAQQEERSAKISSSQQAKQDAIVSSGNKQLDEAIWGTALEYIKALDQEDYYTLIVIDNALKGYQKDYSRDRATIDAETAGWVEQAPLSAWNISYRQPTGSASAPASAPVTPAPPSADKQNESKDESPKEKVKKGLRGVLKGLQ